MKRITASEARRNWFRLLDEVADGETVLIERGGRRILLRREEGSEEAEAPDYSEIIRAPAAARADEWGWEWPGEEGELSPRGGGHSGKAGHGRSGGAELPPGEREPSD